MMSLEEMKALRALINIKEHIENAKKTGIGLYDAGIFSSKAQAEAQDEDETEDEDESESK